MVLPLSSIISAFQAIHYQQYGGISRWHEASADDAFNDDADGWTSRILSCSAHAATW